MAKIGDSIRPELGRTNYDAFLRGSSQGAAAMGRGIADLGKGVGNFLEDRAEAKKTKSAGIQALKSFMNLSSDPQVQEAAQQFINEIEDAPLGEAAAKAATAQQFIGTAQQNTEMDLRRQIAFANIDLGRKNLALSGELGRAGVAARERGLDIQEAGQKQSGDYQQFLMDQTTEGQDRKDILAEGTVAGQQAVTEWLGRGGDPKDLAEVRELFLPPGLPRAGQLAFDKVLTEGVQGVLMQDAEAEAATRKAALEADSEKFKETSELRKEFYADPQVKNYATVATAYRKALASGATPAGDIALVFAYMKLNDPNSSVREGEYATAQNAANVPDRIRNIYNKAVDGTILQPDQRKDFLNEAKKMAKAQFEGMKPKIDQLSKIAKDRELNPDMIIPPMYRSFGEEGDEPASISEEEEFRLLEEYLRQGGMTPTNLSEEDPNILPPDFVGGQVNPALLPPKP